MAIQDYKITEQDYTGKDVASLPDEPSEAGMSAAELKAASGPTECVTAPECAPKREFPVKVRRMAPLTAA